MDSKKLKIWRLVAPFWKIYHRWLHGLKYLGFSEEELEEIEKEDEEEMNFVRNLEEEWRKSKIHYSDKELLEIFPEAKKVIPEKIEEWQEKKEKLIAIIKKKLVLIRDRTADEFSRWFWREWVKITEAEELLKIEDHISRLKRLSSVAKGRVSKERLTEEEIQRALTIPIESLINRPLRKSGKALVGLCPFHSEKHPSFYIYPETNSCWCYGCNQGGDVINFVKLLHGYSFKETVQYLIGEK